MLKILEILTILKEKKPKELSKMLAYKAKFVFIWKKKKQQYNTETRQTN